MDEGAGTWLRAPAAPRALLPALAPGAVTRLTNLTVPAACAISAPASYTIPARTGIAFPTALRVTATRAASRLFAVITAPRPVTWFAGAAATQLLR